MHHDHYGHPRGCTTPASEQAAQWSSRTPRFHTTIHSPQRAGNLSPLYCSHGAATGRKKSSGAATDVARQRHLFFPEVEICLQAHTILRSHRIYISSIPGLPVHPARHDNLTSIHGEKKGGLSFGRRVFPCLREESEITMITTPRYSRKSLSAHCLVLGSAGWLGMAANHRGPYRTPRCTALEFCGGFAINAVLPIDRRTSPCHLVLPPECI